MTNVHLADSDFKESAYANTDWRAKPAAALPYETLFSPTYWSNVARRVRADDTIRVVPYGQAYFAELLVLEVGPKEGETGSPYVRVVELRKVNLNKVQRGDVLESISAYKIKDRAEKGWSVIRKVGGAIVKEGLATEGEAAAWLAKNSKPAEQTGAEAA